MEDSTGSERPHLAATVKHRYSAIRRDVVVATIVILAGVLTASFTIYRFSAHGDVVHRAGPVVCREPVWDCGTVDQDKPTRLRHRFILANLSSESIPVRKVSPDCGCIIADNPPREIKPSSSVQLEVEADLVGNPGQFQKLIHVVLGTSPASNLTLAIRGYIAASPAFYVVPERVDFGAVGDHETRIRHVKIARYDGTPVRLVRAAPRLAALRVVEVLHGDERDSFSDLSLSIDGSLLRPGDEIQSSLIVITDHPKFRNAEIPITARIVGESTEFVESLFVERLASGKFVDKPITAGHGPFPKIESVRYEGDGPITVEMLPAEANGLTHRPVTVRVLRSAEPTHTRICRGLVIAKVAGRSQPLRIPLGVYLRE